MPDYSLVPLEYQPDFSDFSLGPVDHDPFAPNEADGMIHQANIPLANQPQRASPYNPEGDAAAMSPETYVNPFVQRTLGNLATLPQRAIDASAEDVRHLGEDGYTPQSIGPAVETAMTISGFPKPSGEASRLVAGTAARDADLLASKSAGMYNPPVKSSRPFTADYPAGAPSDVAGNLSKDIEGRNLAAEFVVGRRTLGGMDEALTPAELNAAAKAALGQVPESASRRAHFLEIRLGLTETHEDRMGRSVGSPFSEI
jgi:hypothetical protein